MRSVDNKGANKALQSDFGFRADAEPEALECQRSLLDTTEIAVALCSGIAYYCNTLRDGGDCMTTAVRVSENLVREARLISAVDNRSVTGQIEHWARVGKCAEENPDLTYRLIKDILIGIEELEQGESSEYQFG